MIGKDGVLLLTTLAAFGCDSGRKPARYIVPSHWNEIASAAGSQPRPRTFHAMAFDDDRSKLVVFGGTAGGGVLAELWEWDSATAVWTDRTPAPLPEAWPTPRLETAFAYDRGRKRFVMFGGYLADASGRGIGYGDTWEWDPATGIWIDTTPGPGAAAPSARFGMPGVYDESRGRVFVWGGFDNMGNRPIEAWEWDGQLRVWTDRSPSPIPRAWPTGRDGHNMAYDPISDRVLLYGGYDGEYFGDLWAWEGTSGTWANLTPTPLPQSWPQARHSVAMAVAMGLNRLVIFGGYAGDIRGDLWERDLPQGGWRERTPKSQDEHWPGARSGSAMAWDSRRERLLLFGGFGREAVGNAVWEWDGS